MIFELIFLILYTDLYNIKFHITAQAFTNPAIRIDHSLDSLRSQYRKHLPHNETRLSDHSNIDRSDRSVPNVDIES